MSLKNIIFSKIKQYKIVLLILIVIVAGIGLGFVYSKLGKMNVEEIDETAIGIDEESYNILRFKRFPNLLKKGDLNDRKND